LKMRQCLDNPRSTLNQRTHAAAALIALDSPTTPAGPIWMALGMAQDPGPRVELLEWLVRSAINPSVLADHIEAERDPSIRLTVIQCLADLGVERPDERSPTQLSRLLALYREDHDPGVHSSIAYLLRRWDRANLMKAIDDEFARKPKGSDRWYVNSQGHTMAIIGGADDLASRLSPDRLFPYRFAIATTETTLGQYLKFKPSHKAERTGWNPLNSLDAPADLLCYDDSAQYCNWLSEQDGLAQTEWCYFTDKATGRMGLYSNYLTRKGYRLPSLKEWEYAARAGTTTNRYFGNSPLQVSQYTWNKHNTVDRAELVGLKKPNGFGLFDILGNLAEWCYNPDPPHNPGCSCGASKGADCSEKAFAALRGGCFYLSDAEIAATPNHHVFDLRRSVDADTYTGFRVVQSGP
jgi:formylglycine-generating enzyme required for sulfatase activity